MIFKQNRCWRNGIKINILTGVGQVDTRLHNGFGFLAFRASWLFFQDIEQPPLCRHIPAQRCSIFSHLKICPAKRGRVGIKVWPVRIRKRNESVISDFLRSRRNGSHANCCLSHFCATSYLQTTIYLTFRL